MLDAFFDNVWYGGYGVNLMYEPGRDTNLRALVVPSGGAWDKKPVFQPLADGIVDSTTTGFDDLSQIRLKLCASVANPGGTVSNPRPCY
jgi:hypothetical protein